MEAAGLHLTFLTGKFIGEAVHVLSEDGPEWVWQLLDTWFRCRQQCSVRGSHKSGSEDFDGIWVSWPRPMKLLCNVREPDWACVGFGFGHCCRNQLRIALKSALLIWDDVRCGAFHPNTTVDTALWLIFATIG